MIAKLVICPIIVASAAPAMPILHPKISSGSTNRVRTPPLIIAIIE